MGSLVQKSVPSPVGSLRLVSNDTCLVAVLFPSHRGAPNLETHEVRSHRVLDHAARELEEYFLGTRQTFSTPLAREGTAFQRLVWSALLTIPFAGKRSYKDLATMVERPRAMRAVGSANGRNLLSIFVPCHRVIASSGELTGYAGGVDAKRWLLEHERAVFERRERAPNTTSPP